MKTLIFILSLIPMNLWAPPTKMSNSDIFKIYTTITLPKQFNDISGLPIPKTNIQHLQLLKQRAKELGIPERILYRLIFKESTYNSEAISRKGALGYCQLMPKTYEIYKNKLNYSGSHTPEINIIIGTQYLADLYNRFGTWELALGAYNGGKRNVIKYNGIPPFKETKDFVKFINQ